MKLSFEEFKNLETPFHYIKMRDNNFSEEYQEKIENWLEQNTNGFYFTEGFPNNPYFVFEHEEDLVAFKMVVNSL